MKLIHCFCMFPSNLSLLISLKSQENVQFPMISGGRQKLIKGSAEAAVQSCSVKKGALRNFAKLQTWGFIEKEALAHSCEFCEISKSTFPTEHLWWLLLYMIWKYREFLTISLSKNRKVLWCNLVCNICETEQFQIPKKFLMPSFASDINQI